MFEPAVFIFVTAASPHHEQLYRGAVVRRLVFEITVEPGQVKFVLEIGYWGARAKLDIAGVSCGYYRYASMGP